uniref:Uncharacterized protein n=1 Tax=Molossus molossus TaxID=27622 RepID=A0A7J8E2I0_MOLMO|nr:hypothetical protein HJG59_008978 [Molossus molossus]
MQWTAAGNKTKLDRCWAGLPCGPEIQGSGLNPGPAEDEIGLLPWCDGRRWDLGGNLLNFTSPIELSKNPHPPKGAPGHSFPCGTPRTPLPCLAGVAQWWSVDPWIKRSPVRFPIKAHAQVVGRMPGGEHAGGRQLMFSLISVSISLLLPSSFSKKNQ